MRISDWSSDVCSSDRRRRGGGGRPCPRQRRRRGLSAGRTGRGERGRFLLARAGLRRGRGGPLWAGVVADAAPRQCATLFENRVMTSTPATISRSEEHTSELQSLMRISYAVFCLNKKKNTT